MIDQSHFDEVEQLLLMVLENITINLSDQDAIDIREYIEHGEYGLAYELMKFIFDKNEWQYPASLVTAARKMGMY